MNPQTSYLDLFLKNTNEKKNSFRRNIDPDKVSKLAQLEMCRG